MSTMSGQDTGSPVHLSAATERAIQKAVAAAMVQVEDRLKKSENDWKSEASDLLSNVAKTRRYVEDFVAQQGNYVSKLNAFADEFRMELDSKFQKGASSSRVAQDVLAEQDLPSDYYWRLERLERQVGTHRYLQKNKEARSVNERLLALENATGIIASSEAYADESTWGGFQSVPMSTLRVFSREVTSAKSKGPPQRTQNAWENSGNVSRALVPSAPRSSSSSRAPRAHSHGAAENESPPNRTSSTAPGGTMETNGSHSFDGSDKRGELPAIVPSNGTPGSATQFVAATLQDMNVLMKIERDSKFNLQGQLAELAFELDQKKLADEELRKKVDELLAVNQESKIKEGMLLQQKDHIANSLTEAEQRLSDMQDRMEKEKADAVEKGIDNHPAVRTLKRQVTDMDLQLKSSQHHNTEYEKSIKDLMKFTKDVEAKRSAALEEKNNMATLLKEAKQQLLQLQDKLEKETDLRKQVQSASKSPVKPANIPAADGNAHSEPPTETPVEEQLPSTAAPAPIANPTPNPVPDTTPEPAPLAAAEPIAIDTRATEGPDQLQIEVSPKFDNGATSDMSLSPDVRAVSAPSSSRPESIVRQQTTPVRPTTSGNVQSNLAGDVASLKAEFLKEDDFLKQVNALRTKVKEDINAWLVNFKNENGRDATATDKEAIASKYKAYKEATMLKEHATGRIKNIKTRFNQLRQSTK